MNALPPFSSLPIPILLLFLSKFLIMLYLLTTVKCGCRWREDPPTATEQGSFCLEKKMHCLRLQVLKGTPKTAFGIFPPTCVFPINNFIGSLGFNCHVQGKRTFQNNTFNCHHHLNTHLLPFTNSRAPSPSPQDVKHRLIPGKSCVSSHWSNVPAFPLAIVITVLWHRLKCHGVAHGRQLSQSSTAARVCNPSLGG